MTMNAIGFSFFSLIALLLAAPIKAPLPPPDLTKPIPKLEMKRSAERTAFYETAKYLDLGGQFFLYLSAEQALADAELMIKRVQDMLAAVAPVDGPRDIAEAKMVLKLVQAGFKESGARQISGFGASSIATQRGFFRSVAMLHRYADAKEPGILWTALGEKPHAQAGLQLLPASTVLASHGDVDVNEALVWLKKFIAVNAPAEVAREFAQGLVELNREHNFENLLAGYAGEMGLLVTLDEKRRINIPLPGSEVPLMIPEPGLALVLKIKGAAITDTLKKALEELPAGEAEEVEGVALHVHKIPEGLPVDMDIRPTWFVVGGYLVLASNPSLAREIIAVQKGRNKGLSGTAEFQRLAKGLELEGNHLHYVSARLGQTYFEALHSMFERAVNAEVVPAPLNQLIKQLLADGRNHLASYLGVLRVQEDGLLYTAHATRGGPQAAAGAAGGNAVALVLPALMKARAAARTTQSMNNLRQLSLAAHTYAADKDGLPVAGQWCDALMPYMENNEQLFVSPSAAAAVQVAGKKPCSYAMNAKLSGLKLTDLTEVSSTVLFYESNLGWNGAGGENTVAPANDGGECLIAFADGHIQRVPKAQLKKLRWAP